MKTKLFFLVLFLGFSNSVSADKWLKPKIRNYFSNDSVYMLRVFPTEFPVKYNDWKRAKPKKKAKFTPADTTVIMCHAILFKINDADTLEIWNRNLINMIAPINAIVANDGKSIVTFDNHYSTGYGVDVMVTYDSKGDFVNRYSLEEFSPFPINDYQKSITSLFWRCGANYLDDNNIEICFRRSDDKRMTRKYNIIEQTFYD